MNWARAFFGILVIAVGILLLLGNLDVLDAGEVIGTWWPIVLVAGGVIGLAANPRHWVVPAILILGGGGVLLRTTGVIDSLGFVIPAVVILVGLFLLFGRDSLSGRTEAGDSVTSFSLFAGSEMTSHSKGFQGGRVGAVFGGAELDLRDAGLAPGATLDVFAAFGGVEVRVPQGWRVDINGFPIFGGFENATAKDSVPADAPHLTIGATVLFGALEVKH